MPLSKAIKAYWRFEYAVSRAKKSGDPFVGYQKAPLKKKLIIAKGKYACLVLNRFPYSPGHLLAIPYRAVGNIGKLTVEENHELMDLMLLGKRLLEDVLNPEGINIGINQGGVVSGASVTQHAHWHLVPRWQGDHSFFTIFSGARVLIDSQERLWKALRQAYLKPATPKKTSKRKKIRL